MNMIEPSQFIQWLETMPEPVDLLIASLDDPLHLTGVHKYLAFHPLA